MTDTRKGTSHLLPEAIRFLFFTTRTITILIKEGKRLFEFSNLFFGKLVCHGEGCLLGVVVRRVLVLDAAGVYLVIQTRVYFE